MGSYSQSHMTPWSSGHARWLDKLKHLHLHYHSTYGHQTWQDDDLPWWAPTHKITSPFNHVVLQDNVTNSNCYISTTTYNEERRPILLYDSSITVLVMPNDILNMLYHTCIRQMDTNHGTWGDSSQKFTWLIKQVVLWGLETN